MTEHAAPSDRSTVREGVREGRLPISEFAAEMQGGLSPFGEDVEFPLPPDRIDYRHPTAEDRPHLAGDPVE